MIAFVSAICIGRKRVCVTNALGHSEADRFTGIVNLFEVPGRLWPGSLSHTDNGHIEYPVALHAGIGSAACVELESMVNIVPVDRRYGVLSLFIVVGIALVVV